MKLISWNIAQRPGAWRALLDSDADVALLQEAPAPPPDIAERISTDAAPWRTGPSQLWRAAVARLSDRVSVEWLATGPLFEATAGELGVSRPGTLAAALITSPSAGAFIAISAYGLWERAHRSTGSRWIYADASVHRLISDLSALIGHDTKHSLIVAGDFNVLHGYGENGSAYWASRYATVFSRMTALGLTFVGPQAPGGRSAYPWPDELPETSKNVPTYHTNRQTPETCTRQLDFVFASHHMAERVRVAALNDPHEWGPSDHCRIEILVT